MDGSVTELINKVDELKAQIETHNISHEADMARIMPVLEAYESAQKAGRVFMKILTVLTAIGGGWLMVRQIWPTHI